MRDEGDGGMTSVKYEQDRAVVRLVGPVEVGSILSLCDEVDLALEYYQYPNIELQLASPGGDVGALDHFLSRLTQWRATPGVRIGTLALTQAASAAAVILTLGDIGDRTAYKSAHLLYHDSRLMLHNAMATRTRLDEMSKSLMETDKRMLDMTVEHVWQGCFAGRSEVVILNVPDDPEVAFAQGKEIRSADDLGAIYAELNVRDRAITPEAAKALYLIDTIIS